MTNCWSRTQSFLPKLKCRHVLHLSDDGFLALILTLSLCFQMQGGSWYVFAIDGGSDTLNVCTPDTCGIGDVYEKKATAVYEFK